MENEMTTAEFLMSTVTRANGFTPKMVESVAEVLWQAQKYKSTKKELEDWKELFYLLKTDHELLENFRTNNWIVQARRMGLELE